jgi:hypothetical protein
MGSTHHGAVREEAADAHRRRSTRNHRAVLGRRPGPSK